MFQKTYSPGLLYSQAGASWSSVIQNYDGGYTILSGYFYSYLVKTNSLGDTLWTKSYNIAFPYCFQKTTDGGYIILGGDGKIILFKTDSIGNILWSKNYGNSTGHLDNGYSVQQTNDGGYIIGANILQPAIGYRIYIVKTDSFGNIQWTKRFYYGTAFGNSNNVSVVQTSDGNYVVSGTMIIPPNQNIVLLKFQSNGNLIWSKCYTTLSSNSDQQFDLKQTNDEGFIIVGLAGGNLYNSLYLIKTDSIGNVNWSKSYGILNSAYPYSVCATNDGGYIFTGFEYGIPEDIYIIKTDDNGNISWSKSYGAQGYDGGTCVKQTLDGGYVLTGYTEGVWPTPKGFFLIKTDSLGNSGCNESIPFDSIVGTPSISISNFTPVINSFDSVTNVSITMFPTDSIFVTQCPFTGVNETDKEPLSINIYPNPFSDQTIFMFSAEQKNTTIRITDLLGKEIRTMNFEGRQLVLDKSEMKAGIYFVQTTDEKKNIINKKIIIQ